MDKEALNLSNKAEKAELEDKKVEYTTKDARKYAFNNNLTLNQAMVALGIDS